MLVLVAVTVFLGALLLFLVQPMVARTFLPALGGSPAVWNTCMVFFQAALLAGYAYAHWAPRAAGPRRMTIIHAVVVLAPIALLRRWSGPEGAPGAEASPALWLLTALAATIGLPFFALSTSAPLLQRWFSATDHASARDPYFLYAASNAGSLLALLAYPLLVESRLTLGDQRAAWSAGYGVFATLTIACGVATARRTPTVLHASTPGAAAPMPRRSRLFWIACAAVPSSLMLGVTQHLSTDIAAVPLLWIVPLAIYLLTYILAFSRRGAALVRPASNVLPLMMVGVSVAFMLGAKRPIHLLFLLHLLTLFTAGLLCHGRLAASRPEPGRLTEFYLLIALGGVLGGAFNGLLAPIVFNGVYEYPIALVLACVLRLPRAGVASPWATVSARGPVATEDVRVRRVRALLYDAVVPLGVLACAAAAGPASRAIADSLGNRGDLVRPVELALGVGFPAVIAYMGVRRPVRFALGVAAMLFVALAPGVTHGAVLHRERTFFGVYQVIHQRVSSDLDVMVLFHGTTLHGQQSLLPDRRGTPETYYHPDGPIGEVFSLFGSTPLFDRVGMIGLGTGSLAAYGRPGQRMTFYEIDPAVARIARNPAYFTFLAECRAAWDIVIGDGRVCLRDRAGPGEFGLIVVDAFSSDAIPVHLMTREALALYVSRLRPGGIVAFHVSNQYLALPPIVARIAESGGLVALGCNDEVDVEESRETGRSSSSWVLVARSRDDFGPLTGRRRWTELHPGPRAALWTDDDSNLVGAFRWK